jgi:hypothetical protein
VLSNLAHVALLVSITSELRRFVFLLTSLCRKFLDCQSTSCIGLCDFAIRIV